MRLLFVVGLVIGSIALAGAAESKVYTLQSGEIKQEIRKQHAILGLMNEHGAIVDDFAIREKQRKLLNLAGKYLGQLIVEYDDLKTLYEARMSAFGQISLEDMVLVDLEILRDHAGKIRDQLAEYEDLIKEGVQARMMLGQRLSDLDILDRDFVQGLEEVMDSVKRRVPKTVPAMLKWVDQTMLHVATVERSCEALFKRWTSPRAVKKHLLQ